MDVQREMARVGARLREDRERAGMSQGDVAAMLRELSPSLGVQRPTVSNWETGRNLPCLLQFREMLTAFGSSGDRVLYGRDRMEISRGEATELLRLVRAHGSEQLQRRVHVLLAVLGSAGAESEAPA